jgi:hypothetical protein
VTATQSVSPAADLTITPLGSVVVTDPTSAVAIEVLAVPSLARSQSRLDRGLGEEMLLPPVARLGR